MEFSERAMLFLENRKLVSDTIDDIDDIISKTYELLPARLMQFPKTAWMDFKSDWNRNLSRNFIQLFKMNWFNQNWNGIHLELGHSRDTIYEGSIHLVLHVEDDVIKNSKMWPRLGELILADLNRLVIPGLRISPKVAADPVTTLLKMEIPIDRTWEKFMDKICDTLAQFKAVADIVDEGLWRYTHEPLFLTRFGQSDLFPNLARGENKSRGGQSLNPSGGRHGRRCLVVSNTKSNFNHTNSRRSILTCMRFSQRVKPKDRLYFSIWAKCVRDVYIRPLADGGPAPLPDGPWIHPWEFGDHCINTGGEWEKFVWTAEVIDHPDYDVLKRGGIQYLLTDTGDGDLYIDEIDFGIIEEE